MLFFCTIASISCQSPNNQYQSPQQAAILSDARYLAGDGTFGAAYSQEDGVEFKEESDVYGNRRGSYSYVDPTGQRRTVTYTAGKNGFQVMLISRDLILFYLLKNVKNIQHFFKTSKFKKMEYNIISIHDYTIHDQSTKLIKRRI